MMPMSNWGPSEGGARTALSAQLAQQPVANARAAHTSAKWCPASCWCAVCIATTMAYKELHFGSGARENVLNGATVLANAVRVTLGPKSKSVLIEKKWGSPLD